MRKKAKILISGIVHGVGFRYFTLNLAQSLSIDGSVRNVTEGVEVLAEGEEQALAVFLQQLRIGPRFAHVSDMTIEWLEPDNLFQGFFITY